MKKVSIIIPAYNAEKTINRCLDSILEQNYDNFEIILLNDGSKDNTEKLINRYTDNRIIYIKKENTGIGDTRNRGIDIATGDYILFLDSDDYLEPDCISNAVNKIEENNSDLIVFDYYIDIDSDKSIEIHIPNSGVTSLKEKPSLTTEINLAPWNKLYRTSFLKETKNCFVVGLKYEDAPFVLKAIKDAKKIDFCSKCLIHYVLGKKGETLTRDVRIFDIFKICLIIENIFIDYDCSYRTDLTVKILSYYLKSSRYIKDKRLRNKFIDTSFEYLDSLNKNWRRSSYLKKMNPIKKLIFTNRQALKLFGNLKNI